MATLPASPRNTIWKFLLPVIAIIALVIGGLTVLKSQLGKGDSHSSDSAVEIRVGATLPDFSLQQFGGDSIAVSSIPSKVFLINFWATWCEACVVEMPSITKLRNAYKDKGFEVLFINVDEEPEAVLPKALKQFGIDFPVYLDTDTKLAELFDVHAIPLTVIMDKNRQILLIETGERDWNASDIRSDLEQWLAKQ